jgi:hypothetical protein
MPTGPAPTMTTGAAGCGIGSVTGMSYFSAASKPVPVKNVPASLLRNSCANAGHHRKKLNNIY